MSLLLSLWNSREKILHENARLENNLAYYSSLKKENIVLMEKADRLSKSNDSLLQKISVAQKRLGLKPKDTKSIVYTETVLRDTLRDTIPVTRDFIAVITPNSETSVTVIRKDSSLTVIPDIRNSQTLFVQRERKYKYKGFFRRLFHLCWKKTVTERYYIDNSNSLIKTGETRVVEDYE